jgi:hypothetical protein
VRYAKCKTPKWCWVSSVSAAGDACRVTSCITASPSQRSRRRSPESRMLGNWPVRFGGGSRGKGPVQQAPRRVICPVFHPLPHTNSSRSPGVVPEPHPCGLGTASADQGGCRAARHLAFDLQEPVRRSPRGGSGPPPVAWHPTVTVSSTTGVPPSRGTAASATTEFGSSAHPATSVREGSW